MCTSAGILCTLSYHSVEVLPPVDVSGASHAKYCKSESIFESDRPRIWPKFVNVLLDAHKLPLGLDSLWLQFSSDTFYATIPFSHFISSKSDEILSLSAGSAGHERWMIRATHMTNHANHECSIYNLVAWFVLQFVHGRQLLDQLCFASYRFQDAVSNMADNHASDESKRISIWPCSQSSNYRTTHYKVSEISVVLIHLSLQWRCGRAVQFIDRWLYFFTLHKPWKVMELPTTNGVHRPCPFIRLSVLVFSSVLTGYDYQMILSALANTPRTNFVHEYPRKWPERWYTVA